MANRFGLGAADKKPAIARQGETCIREPAPQVMGGSETTGIG